MIVKLSLILFLFYGFIIHAQTNKGFESSEELEKLFKGDGSWKHYNINGKTNPKSITKKIDNCLLSVYIENNNSVKLVFVNKETVQRVFDNRGNVNMKNLPKGFLCYGVTTGAKIVKIGDKFLFESDGHHISVTLKLLEIGKNKVIFQYNVGGFFGFMNYSSSKKGILNLELD